MREEHPPRLHQQALPIILFSNDLIALGSETLLLLPRLLVFDLRRLVMKRGDLRTNESGKVLVP